MGIAIKYVHDGNSNLGTVVDLWGQYFSYSQHTATIFHIEVKSNSIFYHAIRESEEIKESLTGHVPSVDNLADICTKVVPSGAKRKQLIGKVLHDLY